MDSKDFREFARAAVDFVADYSDNIREREVLPSIEPGYLRKLVPEEMPESPEKWQAIMQDMERVIMPGITHWQSPHFHAYYPTANSFPALVGEILCQGLSQIGFSWISSPACTELEVVVTDWLGKLLGLPEEFLNCSEGPGGGVIQGSASEATLVALLAAKEKTVYRLRKQNPDLTEGSIKSKLTAYASDQSNSMVEKAGILGSVPMRLLSTDSDMRLRGKELRAAVEKDVEDGLIPCFVVATLGTTGTCAFDDLVEIAEVCHEYNIWMHIDAAYAGAAFVCPEYRYLMRGTELADSFNFNPHKWMLVTFDCSVIWVKDANDLVDAFSVDRIYLKHNHQENPLAPDYRHWQIALGRRFRALKVWCVLRLYGAEGVREHIRKQIKLAEMFAKLVVSDERFETVQESVMGLVCFRLKGECQLTKDLLKRVTDRKKIYCIPATYNGRYIIRFVVCSRLTEEKDVEFTWNEIITQANEMFEERKPASILIDGKIQRIADVVQSETVVESIKIK